MALIPESVVERYASPSAALTRRDVQSLATVGFRNALGRAARLRPVTTAPAA